ncbi:MAG: helix-turn-helix domain-containing protein [Anaerolineaceae bacterium]|nr:helix-turn-helix domain-containing protein [Anaerolineaceae bacterium]
MPLGTAVLAADGSLQDRVSWAVLYGPEDTLTARSPSPHELLLIADDDREASRIDEAAIRWANEHQVSAIVTEIEPNPATIATANQWDIPLLLLPHSADLREIQRDILALLVNRRGQLARRSTQVFRQLTQISSHNAGPAPLLEALAGLTGKVVVLQDKRLEIIHSSLQPALVGHWESLERILREPAVLPAVYQDRLRIPPEAMPSQHQRIPDTPIERRIAPIVTHGVGRGFLSLLGFQGEIDEFDESVAEQGAAACALEMAKAKAISNAEKRLLGTFLDRILSNDIVPQEALIQAERFGHDLRQPFIALAAGWYGANPPSLRRLETIINVSLTEQQLKALVGLRDPYVLIFIPAALQESGQEKAMKLATRIHNAARHERPRASLALGIGTAATDLSEWPSAYSEALQAMDLAARLHSPKPLYIEALGIYRLITQLEERDALQSFARETLDELLEYDRRQNADLIHTLEAFFSAHGNLANTAEELNVHRNTLLYRLRRITEIGGVDLKQPETRLALQLALAVLRLLPERQTFESAPNANP